MSALRKYAAREGGPSTEIGHFVFSGPRVRAAIRKALLENGKTVAELAWRAGCTPSNVYRSIMLGDGGMRCPVEWLPIVVKLTGDLTPLKVLAEECGALVIKPSRVRRLRKADSSSVNRISEDFHAAMAGLLSFFKNPDRERARELRQAFHGVMSELAGVRLALQNFGQGDLF